MKERGLGLAHGACGLWIRDERFAWMRKYERWWRLRRDRGLRSQLFWHSLSLIRRLSPLRMTKRGDARFRYSNRKSHFPRTTSCPSGIPLPEEGGRCIISLIPSHHSLLTRSTCKPVIFRFLLLSSALPLYRYVPTGGPHRCGRSGHRPQSACRSGGGDRACR